MRDDFCEILGGGCSGSEDVRAGGSIFKYFIIPLHAFVVMERLSYSHILLLLPLHDHLTVIVDEHVVELKEGSLIIRRFSSSPREIRTKVGTSLPMGATESTC